MHGLSLYQNLLFFNGGVLDHPVGSLADAWHGYAVVDARRAAEADGIDLIKNTFISPHRSLLLYTGDIFSINKIDN